MTTARDIFHKISYLQYPLVIGALYYAIQPYIIGFDTFWENCNNMLVLAGLGISFSTLQDTTKTQNKLSKNIWESPAKGKITIVIFSLMVLLAIATGLYGLYAATNETLKELSLGIIVLGIGLMGLLKAAIEMFENHRKDKNTQDK